MFTDWYTGRFCKRIILLMLVKKTNGPKGIFWGEGVGLSRLKALKSAETRRWSDFW